MFNKLSRNLVEHDSSFFAPTFSRPFKDQSGAWRNGTSIGLNHLEALATVAREAKEECRERSRSPLDPSVLRYKRGFS
jgi:hypothetical protein